MTLFLDRTEKGKKSAFDTAVAEEVADEGKKGIEMVEWDSRFGVRIKTTTTRKLS